MRIDVWTLDPATVAGPFEAVLAALLDAEERARAVRFLHDRSRREHVAAHALKRAMVAALMGVAPSACRFAAQEGGKPTLVYPGGLHFNLSHCRGLVAVAASRDAPVGIDTEPIGSDAPLDIASMVLAPTELFWLDTLMPSERSEWFIRFWTLKEAFVKATGRGLSEPLRGFTCSFDPVAVSFLDPSRRDAEGWSFAERRLARHRLALAWLGPADAAVSVRAVRPEELQETT